MRSCLRWHHRSDIARYAKCSRMRFPWGVMNSPEKSLGAHDESDDPHQPEKTSIFRHLGYAQGDACEVRPHLKCKREPTMRSDQPISRGWRLAAMEGQVAASRQRR